MRNFLTTIQYQGTRVRRTRREELESYEFRDEFRHILRIFPAKYFVCACSSHLPLLLYLPVGVRHTQYVTRIIGAENFASSERCTTKSSCGLLSSPTTCRRHHPIERESTQEHKMREHRNDRTRKRRLFFAGAVARQSKGRIPLWATV